MIQSTTEPKIVTSDSNEWSPPENTYVHLDDYDDTEPAPRLQLYTFEHEERHDELSETINALKSEYIFATGIIFPDWIESEIDEYETELLNGLSWVIAFGEVPRPGDVEIIRDHL